MGLDRILGEMQVIPAPHGKLYCAAHPAWAAGQQVVMWNIDPATICFGRGGGSAVERTSGDIILYHGVNEAS
jgi:hypothetical protein